MPMYARPAENKLIPPSASEFRGVPNWTSHDTLLRSRGYLPLSWDGMDIPQGLAPTPEWVTAFHTVSQSMTRVEPRREDPVTREPFMEDDYEEDPETHEMRKAGEHQVTREVPVTYDTSYIQVDGYEIPEPPAPVHTVDDYNRELEGYLAEVRCARGYTDRDPSEYYNSAVPRWHQDAVDWIRFRDAVMTYGLSVLNAYEQTGEAPCTLQEFSDHLRTIPCEWAEE